MALDDKIRLTLARHEDRDHGEYSAGTASIGRPAGGSQFFDRNLEYPVSVRSNADAQLLQNDVTTFHEVLHYNQYMSTVFGLNHFRSANFALEKMVSSDRYSEYDMEPCLRSLLYYQNQMSGSDFVNNTATLFEGFAFAAEINIIVNAVPSIAKDRDSFVQFLNERTTQAKPLYSRTLNYCLEDFEFPVETILFSHAAIIDIALMSAQVHLSHAMRPTNPFVDPFEMFLWAGKAASSVAPLRSGDDEEVQRFQDDICRLMKMGTTSEMALIALDDLKQVTGIDHRKIENILPELWDEGIRSSIWSFAKHIQFLTVRLKYGAGFCSAMIEPYFIRMIYQSNASQLNFYDIDTRKPEIFDNPSAVVPAVIGAIAEGLATGKMLPDLCPLKIGKPFFCPSADRGEYAYCQTGFEHRGKIHAIDCPAVSILGKISP